MDHLASVSPNRDDTRLKIEIVSLREKLENREKQIDSLEKALNALKKEKEILI